MDGTRFDSLARTWSERVTRRRAIGGLFGLAASAGMVAAADDAGAASRTCRRPGDKCVRAAQCCSGLCQLAGRRSRIRTCACPAGQIACRGECVELGTIDHCLACGDACGDGQDCCANGCTDIGTQDNCTACGDACDGANDELCFGTDGCQNACNASTWPVDRNAGSGFYTTDNPPVFFLAQTFSATVYGDPVNRDKVVRCTTSADCPDCDAALAAARADSARFPNAVGCGCIQFECGDNGNGDFSGAMSYYDPGIAYACGVVYTPNP